MDDRDAVAFLQWALPRMGLRWPGFRKVRGQVKKRIQRRMSALGDPDLQAYRRRLEADPAEWRALDALCRITISRFHRERRVFERLRARVLPDQTRAARDHGERALRVWSCGCASGEEPWSIAIAFHLEVAREVPGVELDLVSTDVDPIVLERARVGCYEPGSLHEVPSAWRDVAFDRGGSLACVADALRAGVTFRREDVRDAMPEGPFRVILCRYLAFTYFDEPLQRRVLDGFLRRLAPGGALVVGAHERLPACAALEPIERLPIFVTR